MQPWHGGRAQGYISEEHQDDLIMNLFEHQEHIKAVLELVPPDVKAWHVRFEKTIGWNRAEKGHPYYAMTQDGAGAHSWTWWPHYRNDKQRISRLDIPEGEPGWVPLAAAQLLPSTPRVQDCVGCAVEMVIKACKSLSHQKLVALEGTAPVTMQQLWECVRDGVEEGATQELCSRCFGHGAKACHVFSARTSEIVEIQVRGKNLRVHGTNGGWVPRPVNG